MQFCTIIYINYQTNKTKHSWDSTNITIITILQEKVLFAPVVVFLCFVCFHEL